MLFRYLKYVFVLSVLSLWFSVCQPSTSSRPSAAEQELNVIADSYVVLVLALGEHDKAYVDAYYGDPTLLQKVKEDTLSLDTIVSSATRLAFEADAVNTDSSPNMLVLRKKFLATQLRAVAARASMVNGHKFSFDEESKAIYDTVAPHHDEQHFRDVLLRLDQLLPGTGPLQQRFKTFRDQFIIPIGKLDAVFSAAIEEARERTKNYLTLADNEGFTVEYVTGKVWSAYNWYKGNNYSLIQVNTEFPIYIDRAVDLAVHEGYPGHHVFNSLLESRLYRQRGWVEYSVYPLYSPQSLIAEGSANYGIHVVFSRQQRIDYERDVLFALAGLDTTHAELYYQVQDLMEQLGYATNWIARQYLDGQISRAQALEKLQTYLLNTPEKAQQRLKFIETNRSYVINYNWGQELVRRYISSCLTETDDQERRIQHWQVFTGLLSSPLLPSALAAGCSVAK